MSFTVPVGTCVAINGMMSFTGKTDELTHFEVSDEIKLILYDGNCGTRSSIHNDPELEVTDVTIVTDSLTKSCDVLIMDIEGAGYACTSGGTSVTFPMLIEVCQPAPGGNKYFKLKRGNNCNGAGATSDTVTVSAYESNKCTGPRIAVNGDGFTQSCVADSSATLEVCASGSRTVRLTGFMTFGILVMLTVSIAII